jgi:hypothetical protein
MVFRAGGTSQGLLTQEALSPAATVSTYLADISEFDPNIADAVYLAWSKAIVIRAAYGDAHDDKAWYGGARRAALHKGGVKFLGIYQYLVAGQDGTAQANALHDLVGELEPGEVVIADFEEGQRSMLTAWYNRMSSWYPVHYLWTYSGLNFGQAQGALPVEWLADYTSVEPSSPHTLWQFTDRFSVPGVGSCDCSVYHGTADQLAALAKGAATPPPAVALTPAPAGIKQAVHPTAYSAGMGWDAVPGIRSYHFQLERYQAGFGWVLDKDQQVISTSIVLPVAASTQYRWRVAAGEGQYIWSAWTEFSTQ